MSSLATGPAAAAPAGLAALNGAPAPEAVRLLLECCGSLEWAQRMCARRPFPSPAALYQAADEVWWSLSEADWLEAFRSHPRIGESRARAARTAREREWSSREQAGAAAGTADVRAALSEGNRQYEDRFGYIYIVCATGRSAAEMLALLRERLRNDPAREIRVAAGEQARITRIRLEKLLQDDSPAPQTAR